MAEQIVTVEVDKNGNFSVDLVGFQGKGCKAVADAFASVGKVTKEELKPEYAGAAPKGGTYLNNSR
jgi:Protein of unknown function (DUF2997)